MYVVGLQN